MNVKDKVENYIKNFIDTVVIDSLEDYGLHFRRVTTSINRISDSKNNMYLKVYFSIITEIDESGVELSDDKPMAKFVESLANDYIVNDSNYPVKDLQISEILSVKCFTSQYTNANKMIFEFKLNCKEYRPNLSTWGDTIEDVAKGIGQFKPVTEFYDEQHIGKIYITKVSLSDTAYARKTLTNTTAFKYWDRFQVLNNIFPNWFHMFETVAEYKPNTDIILAWKSSSSPWYEPDGYQYGAYLMHRADFDKVVAEARKIVDTVWK